MSAVRTAPRDISNVVLTSDSTRRAFGAMSPRTMASRRRVVARPGRHRRPHTAESLRRSSTILFHSTPRRPSNAARPGSSDAHSSAVLGLGEAGSRLAADLVAAGVEVHGYDPADPGGTPADAAERRSGRRRRAQRQRGEGCARRGGGCVARIETRRGLRRPEHDRARAQAGDRRPRRRSWRALRRRGAARPGAHSRARHFRPRLRRAAPVPSRRC